jgi:hypothetical protein
VPDQVQDAVGHRWIRLPLRRTRSAPKASTSSRRQTRPEAKAATGSGNAPREMYVDTLRRSHPKIWAASLTPTSSGITHGQAAFTMILRRAARQPTRLFQRTTRRQPANPGIGLGASWHVWSGTSG